MAQTKQDESEQAAQPTTAKPARKKSPRKAKVQVQAPGAQKDSATWAYFGLYEIK